jgi:hypothetical protein
MNKLENLIDMAKLNELLGKKDEEKDECRAIIWILAIIGAIAAVAAIAYAVYRYMNPRYLDDFDDEFEDEFEDEEAEDDEDDFFVDEGEN